MDIDISVSEKYRKEDDFIGGFYRALSSKQSELW